MSHENPRGNKSASPTKDDRIEQLEQELAALRSEFAAYRDAVSKRFSGQESELEQLEQEVSDAEGGSGDDDSSSDNGQTALEQIADDEQDDPTGVQITSSVDRAAAIMKHWFDWSDKAPKGRVLKNGLKRLVETATGETLAWRQIYRAMQKVEQLTKGKIVFVDTDRHGKVLLQPDGRSSSVPGG